MNHIGIDIGKSGAAVLMNERAEIVDIVRFKNMTMHDLSEVFSEWFEMSGGDVVAIVEQVHAMPKQGVRSMFEFGRSLGKIEGLLVANKVAFKYVSPPKWQQAMKCRSKGDKNITKAAAQRLYPNVKITHDIADAILIARYSVENWTTA